MKTTHTFQFRWPAAVGGSSKKGPQNGALSIREASPGRPRSLKDQGCNASVRPVAKPVSYKAKGLFLRSGRAVQEMNRTEGNAERSKAERKRRLERIQAHASSMDG